MTEQEKRIDSAAKEHSKLNENWCDPVRHTSFKEGAQWVLENELTSLRSELAEKEKEIAELKEEIKVLSQFDER